MGMFEACHYCKPPKRTPTCKFDGTCNEYQKARAKYDELKAIEDKKRDISVAIRGDREVKVRRALKHRLKGRKYGE